MQLRVRVERVAMIPWDKKNDRHVEIQQMEEIYERLKTPFKFGPVIKLEDSYTDSPSVFFGKVDTICILFPS